MSEFDYNEGQKHNESAKKEAIEEREELRQLLKTEVGQKFIFRTFEESFLFTTTFTKSSASFFNEGKRDAALKLFNAVLDLDPHIFAQMCISFRNKE